MTDALSMKWGRIVLAAFVMELILFAIAVPLFVAGYQTALLYVIPPLSLISTFAVTVWLLRRAGSSLVLQGALVGVVGTLMYVAVTRAQPEPWAYGLAHVLKVIGGAAGGYVVARRTGPVIGGDRGGR